MADVDASLTFLRPTGVAQQLVRGQSSMVESVDVRHRRSLWFSPALALCSDPAEPVSSSSACSPWIEWRFHFEFAVSHARIFAPISSSPVTHLPPSERNSIRSTLECSRFLLRWQIRVFLLLPHFRSRTGFCPSLLLMRRVHCFRWPCEFCFAKTNPRTGMNVHENDDTATRRTKMPVWSSSVLTDLFPLSACRCGAGRRISVGIICGFDVQELLVLRFLLVVFEIIFTGQRRQRTDRVIIVVLVVRGVQYG